MPLTNPTQSVEARKLQLKKDHFGYFHRLISLIDSLSKNIVVETLNAKENPSLLGDTKKWLNNHNNNINRVIISILHKDNSPIDTQDFIRDINKIEDQISYYYSDPFLARMLIALQKMPLCEKRNDLINLFVSLLESPFVRRLPFNTTDEIEFVGFDKIKDVLSRNTYIVEAKVLLGDPKKSAHYESLIKKYIDAHIIIREHEDIIEPYALKQLPVPEEAQKNLPKPVPFSALKTQFKNENSDSQLELIAQLIFIEEKVVSALQIFYISSEKIFEIIESFIIGEMAIAQHDKKTKDPQHGLRVEELLSMLENKLNTINFLVALRTKSNSEHPPKQIFSRSVRECFKEVLTPEMLTEAIKYLDKLVKKLAQPLSPHIYSQFTQMFDFIFSNDNFRLWCDDVPALCQRQLTSSQARSDVRLTLHSSILQSIQLIIIIEAANLSPIGAVLSSAESSDQTNKSSSNLPQPSNTQAQAVTKSGFKTVKFIKEGDPSFNKSYVFATNASTTNQPAPLTFTDLSRLQFIPGTIARVDDGVVSFPEDSQTTQSEQSDRSLTKRVKKVKQPQQKSQKEKKEKIPHLSEMQILDTVPASVPVKPEEENSSLSLESINDDQSEDAQLNSLKGKALKLREKELIQQLEKLEDSSSCIKNKEQEILQNETSIKDVEERETQKVIKTIAAIFPEYKHLILASDIPSDELRDQILRGMNKIYIELKANEAASGGLKDVNLSDIEKQISVFYNGLLKQLPIYSKLENLRRDSFKKKIEEARKLYDEIEQAQTNIEQLLIGDRLVEAAKNRKADPNCRGSILKLATQICGEIDNIHQFRSGYSVQSSAQESVVPLSLITLSPDALEDIYRTLSQGKGEAATAQEDWGALTKDTESLIRKLKLHQEVPSENLKRVQKMLKNFDDLCKYEDEQKNTISMKAEATSASSVKKATSSTAPKHSKSKPVAKNQPHATQSSQKMSATSAPLAVVTPAPVAAKPAAPKVEIIVRRPIELVPLASSKPSASKTQATPSPKKNPSHRGFLKSDSHHSESLLDQILQEATELQSEIKPSWANKQPLYLTNEVDRLSLRYDTYQLFHKIYLLTQDVYDDINTLSPSDALATSLKDFCEVLRRYRNRLIHKPNYADLKLEEEVKDFILNKHFIEWYTALRAHIRRKATPKIKGVTEENPSELANLILDLKKAVQLLGSYQYLQNNNVIDANECHEQLLFALKLLAFNEEKAESREAPFYKLRRQKASSMAAVIIYEYGYNAVNVLNSEDFLNLKATPLYQALLGNDNKAEEGNPSLLTPCHQFRNRNVARTSEQPDEIKRATLNVDTVFELEQLKQRAKNTCARLRINNLEDSIEMKFNTGETHTFKTAPSTSSSAVILGKLQSSKPENVPEASKGVAPIYQSKLNPKAAVFLPKTAQAEDANSIRSQGSILSPAPVKPLIVDNLESISNEPLSEENQPVSQAPAP